MFRDGDSEELNRVVILTLARAVHIGGLEQVSDKCGDDDSDTGDDESDGKDGGPDDDKG